MAPGRLSRARPTSADSFDTDTERPLAEAAGAPDTAPVSSASETSSGEETDVDAACRWHHKAIVAAACLAAAVACATTPLGTTLLNASRGASASLKKSRAHLASSSQTSDGASMQLPTIDGGLTAQGEVSMIQHYAQNCAGPCGKAGSCPHWCGPGNACCHAGSRDDPPECQGVSFFPTTLYHTCVHGTTGGLRQIPLQPHAPPPMETMDISRPPIQALGYNGIAWRDMSFPGTQEMHILAIGDWGGMDGLVITPEGRDKKEYRRIIQYKGGDQPQPHTMARSRPGCKTPNLVECFNTKGGLGGDPMNPCLATCGWVGGLDDKAQLLVANQFNKRAAEVDPQFVLNVGDNFYWGGIELDCGTTPMTEISPVAKEQFDHIFEGIYRGPGIDGKPWLSVLGNHDWGGRYFNSAWDQQIAYTWASNRWVLPAAYYSTHVSYPDQGFTADIFMIDSNVFDAQDLNEDAEHNLCGAAHTSTHASCSSAGGPPSLGECKAWFEKFWREQKSWLEGKLAASAATWQFVVTHFPCGHDSGWYSHLHNNLGLDFLVTGHRHQQELWENSLQLGGLSCIVTGGGGGITSEHPPATSASQYGFFDLAISKEKLRVEMINHKGATLSVATIWPKEKR